MKNWLKFTFLSFFSDKLAKEGVKRGYGNVLLAFVLTLLLLFLGLFAADMAPFSCLYNSAEDFKETAYRVFFDGESSGISINIENGLLSATLNSSPETEGKLIDTVANPDDAALYSVNGYRVVVDTRPSATTFDAFNAVCVKSDGTKISYETYLGLPSELKSGYVFTPEYTGVKLELTVEKVESYEAYLESASDPNGSSYNGAAASLYAELKSGADNMSDEEYACALYEVYCKAYYPDMSAYESDGGAPKVRNYYYYEYAAGGKYDKYLFVFDDALVGSFVHNGAPYVFYGFYSGLNGYTLSGSKASVDTFIKKSFNATASFCAMSRFMNVINVLPFVAIILIGLTLLFFCVRRLLKISEDSSFGDCLKIIGAFVLYSALFAAIFTFVFGFIAPGLSLSAYALLFFMAALALRSGIYLVREFIAAGKNNNGKTSSAQDGDYIEN